MPIHPLPQFEADLAEHLKDEQDRLAYEKLNAPKTIVVRFGYMKMVGEFPWKSDEKPGCGSKIVVRTHRGTEIGEMLTSTCANSGCSKSVSRKEMLEYIENSGGRQYPFSTDGRALRVANREDTDQQAKLEQSKHGLRTTAKRLCESHKLPMRIVEVEPLLGGERTTVYFSSDDRIDFREFANELQDEFGVRIDMRQVGARDEARITADYERCGQYCCCKNFLKVLKPISMKSAKVQKATLDPLKISGRCGRLMCCLRYEDETYDELRKKLPHRKSRVGTPEGDGMVLETQILTQLAMILLDTGTRVAIPVEELTEPISKTAPDPATLAASRASASRSASRPTKRAGADAVSSTDERPAKKSDSRSRVKSRRKGPAEPSADTQAPATANPDAPAKKKRRRRRKKPSNAPGTTGEPARGEPRTDSTPKPGNESQPSANNPESGPPKKKRRRRRRKPSGGGSGTNSGPGSAPDSGPPTPSDN
ncbi:MAG: regulatory iron-sulfur-containing complex subunit RicT [Phycisphaerales bacterium]